MKFVVAKLRDQNIVAEVNADGKTASVLELSAEQASRGISGLLDIDVALVSRIESVNLDQLEILPPILETRRNLFCVGKNFHEHAREFTMSGYDAGSSAEQTVPESPIIFSKVPESIAAHSERINLRSDLKIDVDYEAELAVIIGKAGKNICADEAMEHVWGFSIANDVTARDLQAKHKQWLIGKSFDQFCPMGPFVVTRDHTEVLNGELKCWVNDELRQKAYLNEMIFDIAQVIETISRGTQLLKGDVILMGTPAGVGIGMEPKRFLQSGDRVDIEISGIGRLSNQFI